MEQIEPQIGSSPRHTRWDALVAAVLGLALLTAGWKDTRAYIAHRGQVRADFAIVDTPSGTALGDLETYHEADTHVMLEHIGNLESDGQHWFRHSLGPESIIRIWSQHPHATLELRYSNDIADQDITVTYDGQMLDHFDHLAQGVIARSYPLSLRSGVNELVITFARYNHHGAELTSADSRPMAGTFLKIDLNLR